MESNDLRLAVCAYKIAICALNSYFESGIFNNEEYAIIMTHRKRAFADMMDESEKATPEEKQISGFYSTITNLVSNY